MAGDVTLQWSIPPTVLGKAVGTYPERVLAAVFDLAQVFAARIEAYGKRNARWVDRTGNARQGLTARAFKTATAVIIVFFGTVSYQIWLELANAGRFAIILESLQAHYSEYFGAIKALL